MEIDQAITPCHNPKCLRAHPRQNYQIQMTCLETTGHEKYKLGKNRYMITLIIKFAVKKEVKHINDQVLLTPARIEQQLYDPQTYKWVIQLH